MEAHGGEGITVTEQGCSTGTSVIVENLFANVPARRKFLKKDVTETMAVSANVEKLALSNPQIAFRLIADGNVKLETAGDGDLKSTVYALYGRDFANRLLEVQGENEGVEVSGFIGRTDNFKANRNYQNFFINGRYIKTKTGMAAIEQAYTSYIPPEKFPGCVIYIDIAPNTVDVNVHPSKLEVKFSNERPVFDAIYHSVRTALAENVERPQINELEGRNSAFVSSTKPSAINAFAPIIDRALEPRSPYKQIEIEEAPIILDQPKQDIPEKNIAQPKTPEPAFRSPRNFNYSLEETPESCSIAQQPVHKNEAAIEPVAHEEDNKDFACKVIPTDGAFYRLVGEVFNSYILVESGNKMLMIDKHAAHERLIFESLKRSLKDHKPDSQLMALPVEVMLMSGEIALLEEFREQIEGVGFAFTSARNTVYISAIPTAVSTNSAASMFEAFADSIKHGSGVELTADIVFEKALYQASCKAAIKAGRVYPEGYAEWLVREIKANPEVICCPHGRPIAIEITKNTIDHLFKRT
jgi:DNA mismatch repair protein MutL